jgi:peroxiredoxin
MTERTRARVGIFGGRQGSAIILVAAMAVFGVRAPGAQSAVHIADPGQAIEPPDSPLPEIAAKDLAARIKSAWSKYDRGLLEIVFENTVNMNWRFMMNQGKPDEQKPVMVQFPGRVRFLADGRLWRVEYDSMMPTSQSTKLGPDRWKTGFDGTRLYEWDIMRNEAKLGEARVLARSWRPRNQFWHRGEEIVEALETPSTGNEGTLKIGQRTVEGFRCYVLARSYPKYGTTTEEIVSPRQGYLIVRTTWSLKGKPYQLHSLLDVRERAPHFWSPGRIVEESRTVRNDGTEQPDRRTDARVVTFEPEKSTTPDAFAFVPPFGADVTDRRLGYSIHNDPWWPEARELLRERFGWPRIDLAPLKRLSTPAKRDEGAAAPPISATVWLNSKPLDLAGLTGKVVLIEFWDMSSSFCIETIPALETLYKTYHPAGLEMISIHTPTDDVNALRRFVREYGMTQPIAVDTAAEGGGATSRAFGVNDRPCVFLMDHVGAVHSLSATNQDEGVLVPKLVSLLEKAGVKSVPKMSEAESRISDEMEKAVTAALPAWIEAAPKSAVIRGYVKDGAGQPIAGARVWQNLSLTLLIFASPGGYQLIPLPPQLVGTTEADGRFAITGLTKGMYMLKVESAGRAIQEHQVAIGPDQKLAEVEIVLNQGDTISGQIRDREGKPIAGASIDPKKWHHRLPNGAEVASTPSGANAVDADATGHFRLSALRHGGYTLEITAPGFKRLTIENVPSGAANCTATLER